MQKQVQYIIKGMNRDMSISKYPSDHSFENKNIRITQREDDTLLSVTNEKGPSELVLNIGGSSLAITGTIIGHCVIRQYIVLFVKELIGTTPNYTIYKNTVYRIEAETGNTVILVQSTDNYWPGTKNSFDTNSLLFGNSIQAFGVYESDSVIKVYWVDNKNQNRFINIVNPKYGWTGIGDRYSANETNFVPLLDFQEGVNKTSVTVDRVDTSNGMFAPGTIQYMCTYYNMYGQETAFFYYSNLLYTSHKDRGGTEEETVSNAFKITIQYPETQFEYVRVYSILRTSINATPQCRIVADRSTHDLSGNTITIIDTGTIGESFDANALLFMCGDAMASKTSAVKDETLFNGNLKLLVPNITEDVKEYFRTAFSGGNNHATIQILYNNDKDFSVGDPAGDYPYNIHLDKSQTQISTFKTFETYRFGVQLLHKTGKWSDVIYIGDQVNDQKIETAYTGVLLPSSTVTTKLTQAELHCTFINDSTTQEILGWIQDNGFIKIRPVVVYPRVCDRTVLAQGIVCPTVYNVEDRKFNRPFAYSSWYARPIGPYEVATPPAVNSEEEMLFSLGDHTGVWNEFRHNTPLPKNTEVNSEIQCARNDYMMDVDINTTTYDSEEKVRTWVQERREDFYVDHSIVTFHSPEIELGTDLDNVDMSKVDFRIVGIVPLTGFSSDIYISTSTIGNLTWNHWFRTDYDQNKGETESTSDQKANINKSLFGPGFYDESIGVKNISTHGWKCRMGNINWLDEETIYAEKWWQVAGSKASPHTPDAFSKTSVKWNGFFVYPWHRSKSLNNTVKPDENGWESALLENKVITNCRYSFNSYYFPKNNLSPNLPYAWTPQEGVSGIKLTTVEPQSEESEVSLIKLPQPKYSDLGELNYYGCVDKVVVPDNTTDTTKRLYKGLGYPIVIAASTRKTDYCKDGYCDAGTGPTCGPRANTSHEIFTGNYDQRYPAYSHYTDCVNNHPVGTLTEYLPERWLEEYYNDGALEDAGQFSDYVKSTNGKNNQTFWNVTTFDPVRLRYKSTKHAVMAFNYYKDTGDGNKIKQVTLPQIQGSGNSYSRNFSGTKFFWEISDDGSHAAADGIAQNLIPTAGGNNVFPNRSDIGLDPLKAGPEFGFLYLGELYRKTVLNRFGGDTKEALEKNIWLPAGEAEDISTATTSLVLVADRGDTYYQRYDCLKTYPFTPDEKNSLIETVSFMCETHLNIDGRYDTNRGNSTKFTITPKNFNLMNPAYNQVNNFFNYQYYNSNRIYPNHFNQIAWSQTKSSMNEIDTWTKLNLASIMDMDGEKGEIIALVNFGNEIWCFQERGISKILFNNRVQIPVSDGVPIEITNGMKVQGKIYLTDKAGCQNKYAMTVTPHGVYFIDGYNSNICMFDGKSINNLSDIKGFKEWMSKQDGVTEWERNGYNGRVDGFRIEYDSDNQDVYFINDDYCLVFSEMLAEFTSFMDYNKVRGMGNVRDNFYSLTDFGGEVRVWKMFDGEYNMFFKPYGTPDSEHVDPDDPESEIIYPWKAYYKPFYVQYNVNPEPAFDKTFDNVEFRSDSWDGASLVTGLDSSGNDKTFDTIEAENEYQYGSMALDFRHAAYSQDSTLKRKFRVWRTIMPREVGTRNRIRNTWCKVKLAWNNPNRYKTVLHDVIIKYFI